MHIVQALFAVALAAVALPSAHAAQSYDNCAYEITVLPTVIGTQGVWCLKKDLATAMASGNAITVNANNVTIECNGFKLGGLGAGIATATIGISATNRVSTTVRGCNVRGFQIGFNSLGGSSHLIEDSRFESNTWMGIQAYTQSATIRRNLISDTGGTAAVSSVTYGIVAYQDAVIVDNTVDGVFADDADGSVIGIYAGSGASVSGNRVKSTVPTGMGTSTGIYVLGYAAVHDNEVMLKALYPGYGISCGSDTSTAARNIITNFTTSIDVCMDAGNVVNN